MNDEVRVGVFVCDCGSNIAAVVNVPDVVEYAGRLPGVVFADEGKWSCSVDALAGMQQAIKEHRLNRVVIASCTPRTHEPLFKRTVQEAGLNPYLLEFVSIREQVSWVHMHEPEAATAKARDLVKMGVAKAAILEEGEEIRLPVG
jgi:heterodisulfide reductase subunit A2